MNVYSSLNDAVDEGVPIVLAAGFFDGVHLGHQHVIQTAMDEARRREGQAWVLTFDPHPMQVIRPDIAPPMLMSSTERLERIRDLGPHAAVNLEFTRALSRVKPEDFVAQLREQLPSIEHFVIGENWRFGRDAAGDVDRLRRLGESLGFEVTAIAPVQWSGAAISSTRIRESIAAGRFDGARKMLGQPYILSGTVVRGRQVGRKLGFPTVNIVPETDVLPPHGVFAVITEIDGERIPGAAYYGHRSARPGVEGKYFLEVYLFDLDEDLYDRFIRIQFVSFIRPDQRFASEPELVEQIRLDTAAVQVELDRYAAESPIPTRS